MAYHSQEGAYTSVDGAYAPTAGLIEGFEDIGLPEERYDNSGSDSVITSEAAIATDEGSTQGLRQTDFQEIYAGPSAFETPLVAGEEARFFVRPNTLGDEQYHFLFGDGVPNAYRFEFHMSAGCRIADVKGARDILATDGAPSWNATEYEVRFTAGPDVIVLYVGERGGDPQVLLSTSNTSHVTPEMGVGWRCSGGGNVDWDWLGYTG